MTWQGIAIALYLLMSLLIMAAFFAPRQRETDAEIDARNLRRQHPSYGLLVLTAALFSPLACCIAIALNEIRREGRE